MNFEEYLKNECNCKDIRFVNDGNEYIAIVAFIYTHAIVKGKTGDTQSYDDRWCYSTYQDAKKAIDKWDGLGEPDGWTRHPASGRRRKDGDKEKESINF